MARRMPAGLPDYWEIILRRKWLMLIPLVLVSAGVFLFSLKVPKIYKSETLILVEPQKVPSDYVKATVTSDVTERLQTISQEILSRTRLQKIISQFGLYSKLRPKYTDEDIVDLMRKQITVDIVADPRPEAKKSVGGFRISYEGEDPKLVQQVTRELASLFIEEHLRDRETIAHGTDEFIESELEKAKVALQSQEERVRIFKAQYMGSLPEQEGANLQMISQLQGLLSANSDALSRADQQRVYLGSLLDSEKKNKGQVQAKPDLELELERKQAELAAAEQTYTASHPDVIRLKSSVNALEQQVKSIKAKTAKDTPSQVPDQIQSQLVATQDEIKRRNQTQKELEAKIKTIQGRVEGLPGIESKFADLNRDYDISRANYQSLLEKKNSSSMATEMEIRAKGEQFRILDPASLPEKPYKPDLVQLNLFGLIGGMVLGMAFVMGAELRDPSLHHKKDAEFYLSMPVLAVIPVLNQSRAGMAAEKRKRELASVS